MRDEWNMHVKIVWELGRSVRKKLGQGWEKCAGEVRSRVGEVRSRVGEVRSRVGEVRSRVGEVCGRS